MVPAQQFLTDALAAIDDRAIERDKESERSMATAVAGFNAMHGTNLTEELGWQFMIFLKLARANGGMFRADDYTDMAGYSALAGECASKEVK